MKKNKLSLQTLKGYEAYLLDAERSRATIKKYMRDIHAFYAFLPEEKIITKEVVIAYKRSLLDVYAPASSNSMLVAVNGLLAYMGPVSYTHLDVYKRQMQQRASSACIYDFFMDLSVYFLQVKPPFSMFSFVFSRSITIFLPLSF